MQFHGEAKCSIIEAFTAFILKTTVLASGVSMVPMSAKVACRGDTTPFGGLRMRSYVAFTSFEVSGVPSWNFTFGCSLNVKVIRSGAIVHESARSPSISGNFLRLKRTRVE